MVSKIRQMKLSDRLASVRSINLHVLDLEEYDRTLRLVELAAQDAIEKEGGEVIVLGYTVMGPIASKLADQIGIPVIEPGTAALKIAETLPNTKWKFTLLPRYEKEYINK